MRSVIECEKQLTNSTRIAIIAHQSPDADALCSAVALKKLIRQNFDEKDDKIIDIFVDTEVAAGITIPGPGKDYALDAVAKRIDSRESDDIDKETIVNAVSTQLSVDFGTGKRLLLTGDSSFAAIENTVKNHSAIQLPHHGKLSQAEDIFAVKDNNTIYFVSDNTGDSKGGSSKLTLKHKRGHVIYNTLSVDQACTASSFKVTASVGSYLWGNSNALPVT